MTRYAKGAVKERLLMTRLEAAGWICYRSAGSHGNADLIALREGCRPLLIQVKADASGAFGHFGPEARYDLYAEAKNAGALALLAWCKPRGPVEWFLAPLWVPIEFGPALIAEAAA